uniref:Uncharacterized protein n=1 Tax=Caenorhabditis tropicalis TaxID=1561998 RepID=A0A1I7TNX2_9PELO
MNSKYVTDLILEKYGNFRFIIDLNNVFDETLNARFIIFFIVNIQITFVKIIVLISRQQAAAWQKCSAGLKIIWEEVLIEHNCIMDAARFDVNEVTTLETIL